MARWVFDGDSFDYGDRPDSEQQQIVFESIFGEYFGHLHDDHAKQLFWDVMYNDDISRFEREDKFEELKDWYRDEYGIEFDDMWDWEDFREWYDSA